MNLTNESKPRAEGNAKARFLAICAVLAIVYIGFSFAFNALADPPASPYAPGATLNPTCSPTSTNCTVYPALYATTSTLPLGGILFVGNASGSISANTSTLYWNASAATFQVGSPLQQATTGSLLLLGANTLVGGAPSGTYIGINQQTTSTGGDFIDFQASSSIVFNVGASGDLEIGTGTQAASNALLTIASTSNIFSVFSNGTVIDKGDFNAGALTVSSTGPTLSTSSALLLMGQTVTSFNAASGTWFGISKASSSGADFLDFVNWNASPTGTTSAFRVASSGALTVSSTAFSFFSNLIVGSTTASSSALFNIATTTNIFTVFQSGLVMVNATANTPFRNGTTSFIVCARKNCNVGAVASNTASLAWFASPDGTQTTQSIGARGYITGGLADVGEFIPVIGDDSDYAQGDVVEPVETSTVEFQQTSEAYDPQVAGVITTTAGLIAGGGQDSHGNTVIALAGRVPVNVTLTNGPIHVGDFLTTSDIPGVAMRSTQPGRVIGMALADDLGDPSNPNATSQVMMFVNPGWSLGNLTSTSDIASSSWALEVTNSGTQVILDQFTAYVQAALAKLGLAIQNGVATLQEIITNKVTTNVLCVQGTCVDGTQLQNLLNGSNAPPVPPPDNGGDVSSTDITALPPDASDSSTPADVPPVPPPSDSGSSTTDSGGQ